MNVSAIRQELITIAGVVCLAGRKVVVYTVALAVLVFDSITKRRQP